jgi:hypothetical protein
MVFDVTEHTFHSAAFQRIVDEAISFLARTPVHNLPPPGPFSGPGVYALYYVGSDALYARISDPNCRHPIYVGKAVPTGWRAARTRDGDAPNLYTRLREHSRSIEQATNLQIGEFRCRFVILAGIEADLLVPVEAELIRRHHPLWNTIVDGFGNHDPGSRRYDQARSEWDALHPGRVWAERLRGHSPQRLQVQKKVREYLNDLSFS